MQDGQYIEHVTERIFSSSVFDPALALEVFRYQYNDKDSVYRAWCDHLKVDEKKVTKVTQIPFLPISFFKSHAVTTGKFSPDLIFESSGTTQTVNSHHLVKDASIYLKSCLLAFRNFYGPVEDYCILGLLPNYLEKGHSSLVKMVDDLISVSGHPDSGFYLYDFDRLGTLIRSLEARKQKTLLLGVTFALLDFGEQFAGTKSDTLRSDLLQHTVIMDTGGMKGRKKEMTRQQVHETLCRNFGVQTIHSEYGMTELLSQAYAAGQGRFQCPPWMQVFVRDENDPFDLRTKGKGLINVVDLANIHSCSFIATDDVGWLHPDYFEVWGRLDHSDLRGCSLLVLNQ